MVIIQNWRQAKIEERIYEKMKVYEMGNNLINNTKGNGNSKDNYYQEFNYNRNLREECLQKKCIRIRIDVQSKDRTKRKSQSLLQN